MWKIYSFFPLNFRIYAPTLIEKLFIHISKTMSDYITGNVALLHFKCVIIVKTCQKRVRYSVISVRCHVTLYMLAQVFGWDVRVKGSKPVRHYVPISQRFVCNLMLRTEALITRVIEFDSIEGSAFTVRTRTVLARVSRPGWLSRQV